MKVPVVMAETRKGAFLQPSRSRLQRALPLAFTASATAAGQRQPRTATSPGCCRFRSWDGTRGVACSAASSFIPSTPHGVAFPSSLRRYRHLAHPRRCASHRLRLRAKLPSVSHTIEIDGAAPITLESGFFARQADGAVTVRAGDTVVYCTVCHDSSAAPNIDFLPLRVDYLERFSAVGRTTAGYIKRDKPGEREILMSRLIDRPLRPCIGEGFFKETQVLAHVFSYDGCNQADTLALCGAAAAMALSTVPMRAGLAAVRVGMRADGTLVLNPTEEQMHGDAKHMDMVVAGTQHAILMIEGGFLFATEEQVLEAVQLAQRAIAAICRGIDEFRQRVQTHRGQPLDKDQSDLRLPLPADMVDIRAAALAAGLGAALRTTGKAARNIAIEAVRQSVMSARYPSREATDVDPEAAQKRRTLLDMAWKRVLSAEMRRLVLDEAVRPDGRAADAIRDIDITQTPLPCAHGSSLFTRGETQVLAVATLGGRDSAQRSESLLGERLAHFYLQYLFPPFAVGEVGRLGTPGRREIGHGMLAQRALEPVVPSREQFPYVIRVETNVLESNGSSSMASVCGGCLALMDAGVPVRAPVAGVAMGLIWEAEAEAEASSATPRHVILTDILGMEDALGDMDFKVARSADGITALQMDIKVEGVTLALLREALQRARQACLYILERMTAVCPAPRPTLPVSVPKVRVLTVAPKRIGDVIGAGGRVVRGIIEECGGEDVLSIDIDPDGTVTLLSADEAVLHKAARRVQAVTTDVEAGQVFEEARVVKILPFGAYVELDAVSGREAWLHISELEWYRVGKMEDVLREGDTVRVRVTEVSARGQVRVSRKALLPRRDAATNAAASGNAAGSGANGAPIEEVEVEMEMEVAVEGGKPHSELSTYERDLLRFEREQRRQERRTRRPAGGPPAASSTSSTTTTDGSSAEADTDDQPGA